MFYNIQYSVDKTVAIGGTTKVGRHSNRTESTIFENFKLPILIKNY